jgi:hypothetical protein
MGGLDDVVDLEGAPAASLAPPAGAPEHHPTDHRPLPGDDAGRPAARGPPRLIRGPGGAHCGSVFALSLKGGRVQMPQFPERYAMARPGP